MIYHLVSRAEWDGQSQADYRPPSLAAEGFVHCSHSHQLAKVANLFFANTSDLLVLVIDPARLGCPVKEENPGVGERFPHVYGPIPMAAVVDVRQLNRDRDGSWTWSEHP